MIIRFYHNRGTSLSNWYLLWCGQAQENYQPTPPFKTWKLRPPQKDVFSEADGAGSVRVPFRSASIITTNLLSVPFTVIQNSIKGSQDDSLMLLRTKNTCIILFYHRLSFINVRAQVFLLECLMRFVTVENKTKKSIDNKSAFT